MISLPVFKVGKIVLMSVINAKSNIFYSESERLLVINSEPLPNHTYQVETDDTSVYTMKMVGDSLRLVDKTGHEKLRVKPRKLKRSRSDDCPQTDSIINWIHRRCPDIEQLDYLFDPCNTTNEQIIIKGYVQSGKTSFMLCSALKYMFGSSCMSSEIVLRDSIGDSTQIQARLRDMKSNIKDYLMSENISTEVDFAVVGDRIPLDEFNAAMNGINPKIFVVLGNRSQLRRVNVMLKKVATPKYAVFIDEADSNDTGDNYRKNEMTIIKESASRLFYISATILEIGLRDTENGGDGSVYMLRDVPHYMGIEKLIHRRLGDVAKPSNRKCDDPFENDPNMRNFISMFEETEPHHVEFLDSFHPQHCLISCGAVIVPQKKLFNFISEHDIVVILYNGHGIDMYHRSLDGEKIRMKTGGGRTVTGGECKWRPGAHSFGQSIGVSNALQWLKDNGGVAKFPRIITISGKLAGRGISFVSEDYGRYLGSFYNTTSPKWIGWRLTSMYYIPSKQTSQPNLMQCVGRVCCVVRDNIPTHIYANDEVLMDLRKAYWTQEELVIRARQLQEGNDIKIGEAMNQVKMKNVKLSKRRLTINGVKGLHPENILEWFQEDDGFEIDDTYEKQMDVDDGWDLKSTSIMAQHATTDVINMSMEEWTRLTTKMFAIWAKDSSNIAGFMNNLDPEKTYMKSEMNELCVHNNVRMGDVIDDNTGKSNKYGGIIRRLSGKYELHPELVTSFKLNF